ncbi:MAG: hypothetical protein EpisKO_04050 [Epibacterium sp.]
MNFAQKHQPTNVKDLVFRDARLGRIISEYAAGLRHEHLLLEGPTSSGKSIAASMIVKEQLSATLGSDYISTYHGQGFDHRTVVEIQGDWNIQMMSGAAYSVIDEVDFASAEGRRQIRKLIDGKSYGTLICTTNFLNKLEHAFVSRFRVEHVAVPVASDWHSRALQILQAEGHAVTMAQVRRLMSDFSGHARDFMRELEDVHLGLLSAQSASRASASTSTDSYQVSTTEKPSIVPNGVQLASPARPKSLPPAGNGQTTS